MPSTDPDSRSPSALLRPEPVTAYGAERFKGGDVKGAAEALRRGNRLALRGHYRTGAQILDALSRLMPAPDHAASYDARLAHQRAFRQAATGLIVQIKSGRVALEGAQEIGFLKTLYPEFEGPFFLPLVEVQALTGAWGTYKKGTMLPVLGHKLHPFYGTYVPTRQTHLELFGTWLSQYAGEKGRAVDVGTGCGVLGLMLAKSGFKHVDATDINPNAIESVRRHLKRLEVRPPLRPRVADLLGRGEGRYELIVFNPPWLQGEVDDYLDRALHFNDDLFERFFRAAPARLEDEGRIVILSAAR